VKTEKARYLFRIERTKLISVYGIIRIYFSNSAKAFS